jgi:hypothetical protein
MATRRGSTIEAGEHSSRKNEQNSTLKRCNHKPCREAAATAVALELDRCAF